MPALWHFSFSTAKMQLCLLAVALASWSAIASADSTVSAAFDDFSDSNIAFAPSVIAIAIIALGLTLTFAGLRYLRACVFLGALIGGGYAIASSVVDSAVSRDSDSILSSDSTDPFPALAGLASWVGFLTAGSVVGAIAAGFHQRIAYGLLGGLLGVVIAFIVHLAWDHFVLLAIVLGVGIGVMMAGSKDPHPALVIVPSSIAGSALTIFGIAFFTGGFPTKLELVKFWAEAKLRGSWSDAVPSSWWGFFAVFLALAVVGIAAQLFLKYRSSRRSADQEEDSIDCTDDRRSEA